MEAITALKFYWMAIVRGIIDTYHSFGLWTVFAAVISIIIGILAHIVLVQFFPNLKTRLGEPMSRWWIWLVYTLVPLMVLAFLIAAYNFLMAPARLYQELADKPAIVGDPEDAKTIVALTKKLFATETERDSLKAEFDGVAKEHSAVAAERDALRSTLDDREHRLAKRAMLTEWLVRVRDFRATVKQDPGPTRDEYVQLVSEFVKWAKLHLDESQYALLDSGAGVPIEPSLLKGERKVMSDTLRRIEFRLGQYIQSLD